MITGSRSRLVSRPIGPQAWVRMSCAAWNARGPGREYDGVELDLIDVRGQAGLVEDALEVRRFEFRGADRADQAGGAGSPNRRRPRRSGSDPAAASG